MTELNAISREQLVAIIEYMIAERGRGPFITGMSTRRDKNGLPEHLLLCAASGADVVASYRRVDVQRLAEHVVSDPEIRGGIPTLTGTRCGVHEVSDLAAAEPIEQILEDYPSLNNDLIEAAVEYAREHPAVADRSYPRPAVPLDELLDALYDVGADRGMVGTGSPDRIGISVPGATDAEIDTLWQRAMLKIGREANDEQFRRAFERSRYRISAEIDPDENS